MPNKEQSRWKKGNQRYPQSERTALDKYREPRGWFRGARVVPPGGKSART